MYWGTQMFQQKVSQHGANDFDFALNGSHGLGISQVILLLLIRFQARLWFQYSQQCSARSIPATCFTPNMFKSWFWAKRGPCDNIRLAALHNLKLFQRIIYFTFAKDTFVLNKDPLKNNFARTRKTPKLKCTHAFLRSFEPLLITATLDKVLCDPCAGASCISFCDRVRVSAFCSFHCACARAGICETFFQPFRFLGLQP